MVKIHKITFQMSLIWASVHAFFAEIQLFKGRDLKNPIFQKNCLKFSDWKKTEKRTKIEDLEGEAGKILLNTTSANLLCTSSTLGLRGKPGINYQQYGPFFNWNTPSVYCHLYFFASSGECAVNSDWCRNPVIT